MTEVSAPERRPSTWVKRIRAIHFAPVLALIALFAWAFASPIGAGPDDDYHLVSIWCASGGSEQCAPGSQPNTRMVAIGSRLLVATLWVVSVLAAGVVLFIFDVVLNLWAGIIAGLVVGAILVVALIVLPESARRTPSRG